MFLFEQHRVDRLYLNRLRRDAACGVDGGNGAVRWNAAMAGRRLAASPVAQTG